MKTKAIVTLALLLTSGLALAQGGRDINNIDVNNVKPTAVEITEIKVQGPTDQFNVKVENAEKVDTSSLQQSYGSLDDIL